MIRLVAIGCVVVGLSLPTNCFADPLEEMSGTSFDATRTVHGNVSFPLLSVALRAGLFGLGLVAVRRLTLSTK